jgi:glycerol-3-phosphate dehydrogenase
MRMTLSPLQDTVFDVAVIGGGINGASAAQQLAAAGYRTLIVEKGDFGSGSTARSSRLLHCGLRYPAPGRSLFEFVRHPGRFVEALRMARQAMHARYDIANTSPSSVNRMQFCFPIYRGDRYRGWQPDAAFKILSTLGPAGLPLDYERLAPEAATRRPLLCWLRDADSLDSVAVFREYQLDWPERICMDAVLEAERLGAWRATTLWHGSSRTTRVMAGPSGCGTCSRSCRKSAFGQGSYSTWPASGSTTSVVLQIRLRGARS